MRQEFSGGAVRCPLISRLQLLSCPAIGAHLLANVGGLAGGVIYAIISVASGHGIPGQ